jgi:phosphate-selective porin OprO/OprP
MGSKAIGVGVSLLFQVLSISGTAPARAEEWTAKWNKGFLLASADGAFKMKFGGRIQMDFTFANADDSLEALVGTVEDGSEFRRARLFFSGTIYGNVEFKAQYDFAGGNADFKDLYIGLKDTPVGNIRIGHFFEPFSLEALTSSKFTTFLERALPNAFAPARNVGIMFHDHVAERITWAAGAFREADGFGTSRGNGKLNLTGRVTGLPVWEDQGRRLLHLGLSLSAKDLGDDPFRFRQRPEAHQTPRFVDTGSFAADSVNLAALEVAVNVGAFHAQSEYTVADAVASALGDPSFDGWYVQAGYFITGEHRPYDTKKGSFKRLSPKESFGQGGGKGAWEIALRYSILDLDDARVAGGELEDLSLAVNCTSIR